MSRVQLLRVACLLPIAVPLVLNVPLVALEAVGVGTPSWLSFVAVMTFSAILMCGIPYVVLAGIALFVLRHHSWQSHLRAAIAAPWLMVIVAEVFAFATDPTPITRSDMVVGGTVLAIACLIFGYTYVGVALAAIGVLHRTGRIAT